MTGTCATAVWRFLVRLHDVHFFVRNFNVNGIQNFWISIGFSVLFQTIIGLVLHDYLLRDFNPF